MMTPLNEAADPLTSGPQLRPAALLMGCTFVIIAILALVLSPDGFDERAILLGPVAIAVLLAGGFISLIVQLATRHR